MYASRDVHPEFRVMDERSRALLDLLLADIPGSEVTFGAGPNILADRPPEGKFYRLREGVLAVTRHEAVMWYLEVGDVFGLDRGYWPWDGRLSSEFGVMCVEYESEALFDAVAASPERIRWWTEYLGLQALMSQSLLAVALKDEIETAPTVRTYRAGETIIRQGDPAGDVYTLAEGHADVIVDGTKVGEILRDEIFGVFAALGGGTRTASVLASENSLVLSLPREQFAQLIQSRPRLVVKFIEDVARATAAVNARLVERR